MLINLRGSHGSGKTTIVRKVMAEYPKRKAVYLESGRRIPIGYICKKAGHTTLFVPGSYEHPVSGGCDNVQKVDLIYGTIKKYAKKGYNVLFEGIVAQHSTPNIILLNERYKVRVVVIDISAEKALKGVRSRRKKRNETEKFNPANTIKETAAVLSSSRRLKSAGVKVKFAKTRSDALDKVLDLLELR